MVIEGDSLILATSTGKIMLFDQRTLKSTGNSYQAHEKAVTDLWALHDKVILSCSALEKTVYLRSLNGEFESQNIDLGYPNEKPLNCAVIQNKYMPENLHIAVGT